jgi:hypothetical protein
VGTSWAEGLVASALHDPGDHVVEISGEDIDDDGLRYGAVTLRLDLEDVRGETYRAAARLLLPESLRDESSAPPTVWFASGYELTSIPAREQLRKGRMVATSCDSQPGEVFPHPNPICRGPNLDVVLAHLVRGLSFVDPARIAYGGGSAGGYAALLSGAEAFPAPVVVANSAVLNLVYQGAYFFENLPRILADPPPEYPLVPVLMGMFLQMNGALEQVYGRDLSGPGWFPHSPVAHLERITGPVGTLFSTADFLVPIEQVGTQVAAPTLAAVPEGLTMAAGELTDVPEAVVRLVDALGGAAHVEIVPVPEGAAPMDLVDLTLSLPQTLVPLPAPRTPGSGWSVAVVDEGPTEIGMTHGRHAIQPDFDPAIEGHLSVPLSLEQLTTAKLDQLLDRWAGVEWLAPGFRRLDRPAAERADVERGLRSYCATSPAHRRRFADLHAQLPDDRHLLPEPLVLELGADQTSP